MLINAKKREIIAILYEVFNLFIKFILLILVNFSLIKDQIKKAINKYIFNEKKAII